MKRFFLMVLFVCNAACQTPVPAVGAGRIERITDFSSQHIGARTIDVWLPNNYPQQAPYAVLYMHDGQMLFDDSATWNHQEWHVDETAQQLIDAGKTRPFIVVGIWNAGKNRAPEYFPQKVFEALPATVQKKLYDVYRERIKSEPARVYSDRYLTFITHELIPHIEQRFKVSRAREDRMIAGSSMGGLISLYALSEYPDIFGGAACLSTHWAGFYQDDKHNPVPHALNDYVRAHTPNAGQHRLYFDYGTQTLDAIYKTSQLRIDQTLHDKGYSDGDYVSREFVGADHSERAWSARLAIPFSFLLKPH